MHPSAIFVNSSEGLSTQHIITLWGPPKTVNTPGVLRVTLRDSAGTVREETVPCVVEQLSNRSTLKPAE